MPGSGAMGSNLGNWEFNSQTNDNVQCVPEDDCFKFVDDLSILECINLINIGIASHNLKHQVPNDIPVHNQIVHSFNLKTQKYVEDINSWTKNKQMIISEKKTKYQFHTRIMLNNQNIEIVDKMKIL